MTGWMTIARPLLIVLAMLASGPGLPEVRAQEWEPPVSVPALRIGPTRESRAVTARSPSHQPTLPAASIMPRYFAFQRDFAADFGFPEGAPAPGAERADFVREVRSWVASRWGDTTFYGWVERALVAYAQVEARTRFEKSGFDMGVEMDDVRDGKLGVRVSRALDP